MSTSDQPIHPARTYGGWRRSRGMGLFGLGPAQTLLVLAVILAVIGAGSLSLPALAAALLPALAIIGAVVLRWDGQSLLNHLLTRVRWTWGQTRAQTAYRSGTIAAGPHAWSLPGVLAPTQLLAVNDPGGAFGLVWNQRTGTLTATLRVAATSTWLVDRDQATAWVANWGSWLAGLGYLPQIRWVAVTVQTTPASGSTLADYVAGRIAPSAPAAARRILQRLTTTAPAAAAHVTTHVSITFDPASSPTKPRGLPEAADEVARALPGLEDSLAGCGVTVLGRATAGQLVSLVRGAYDPDARDTLDRLLAPDRTADRDDLLDWGTAGPIAADEEYGTYRHDNALSVSWAWHEAPRQQVHADILARLLAPGPHRKRVTLLYRPLSAGQAAQAVDREVNAAVFRDALRTAQRRDENARDRADRDRALRAAREEAAGAGVGLLSLFVTTTVTDPTQLERAVADIEASAEVAKIRLRRLWASQAAGFAVTLPCGICPPQLATHWPR